jgi:hypothetical protein
MKAAILVLAAGCGATTAYRTTRTAPPGTTDLVFGLQVSGATTDAAMNTDDRGAPFPELAIAARHGMTDDVELQVNGTLLPIAKLTTGSLEAAAKWRLLTNGRYSFAVGGGIGYRLTNIGGAIIETGFASAPAIFGIDLGRHQLVLSADIGYQRVYSSGARPVDVPFAGTSLGFVWQVARSWAILPEVGVERTPTMNIITDDSRLFHVGIAAIWRRSH